jgi:hypothetical protein
MLKIKNNSIPKELEFTIKQGVEFKVEKVNFRDLLVNINNTAKQLQPEELNDFLNDNYIYVVQTN